MRLKAVPMWLGLLTLIAGMLASQHAALAQERKKVVLGVGGKNGFYYLPLTITEQLGYFKEQGLEVEIQDFAGGAKSLQALVGGSVDVVTGAYEHTIRMQAKGQDIKAVLELGRYPGFVLAVRKSLAGKVKKPGDLKGMNIGVTAPGSSTHFFVNLLLGKDGVKPDEASFVSVGAGQTAVAAIKQGQIDAISSIDPIISKLDQDGDVFILADTRTEAGNIAVYGGTNPAAALYTKSDYIEKNPRTVQALVNALYKGLKWLETASPEDVAKTVPPEYLLGDRDLFIRAAKNSLPTYSRTGIMTPQGMQTALDMLKAFDPEIAAATVDLSKTFDGRFAASLQQSK